MHLNIDSPDSLFIFEKILYCILLRFQNATADNKLGPDEQKETHPCQYRYTDKNRQPNYFKYYPATTYEGHTCEKNRPRLAPPGFVFPRTHGLFVRHFLFGNYQEY